MPGCRMACSRADFRRRWQLDRLPWVAGTGKMDVACDGSQEESDANCADFPARDDPSMIEEQVAVLRLSGDAFLVGSSVAGAGVGRFRSF